MSPTLEKSTFSKTAIARTDCRFVPFDSINLSPGNLEEISVKGTAKTAYVERWPSIEYWAPDSPDALEAVWKSVTKTSDMLQEQCVHIDSASFISRFGACIYVVILRCAHSTLVYIFLLTYKFSCIHHTVLTTLY